MVRLALWSFFFFQVLWSRLFMKEDSAKHTLLSGSLVALFLSSFLLLRSLVMLLVFLLRDILHFPPTRGRKTKHSSPLSLSLSRVLSSAPSVLPQLPFFFFPSQPLFSLVSFLLCPAPPSCFPFSFVEEFFGSFFSSASSLSLSCRPCRTRSIETSARSSGATTSA